MLTFMKLHTPYTQSVQKIVSKHDLRQVKEYQYLHPTYNLAMPKMGSKRDLHHLQKDVYWRST